ncbi:hypothetical protein ACEV7R_24125, partial [Vibrio parahaemolyticus]
TRYNPSRPRIWQVPLRDSLRATVVAEVPAGGYLVPAAHAQEIGARLALHGIEVRRLEQSLSATALETFRADRFSLSTTSFEG